MCWWVGSIKMDVTEVRLYTSVPSAILGHGQWCALKNTAMNLVSKMVGNYRPAKQLQTEKPWTTEWTGLIVN